MWQTCPGCASWRCGYRAGRIDAYFPEIGPLVADCQYNDCSHLDDPGCAYTRRWMTDECRRNGYESYLRMRFGDDLDEMFVEEEDAGEGFSDGGSYE